MADLSITAADVALVKQGLQYTGPASETITAGDWVRYNATSGKFDVGNGSSLTEAADGGIALKSAVAGQTITVAGDGAIIDVGDALAGLDFNDPVYLSDTDGVLGDADDDGTVTKTVGRVVPGWAHTTADKLLEVRQTAAFTPAG